MSGVASGISANLARHILTERGIKFERDSKSKECFTCPCGVSLVGCGSRTRSSGSLERDFLNCSRLLAVIDYMKAYQLPLYSRSIYNLCSRIDLSPSISLYFRNSFGQDLYPGATLQERRRARNLKPTSGF